MIGLICTSVQVRNQGFSINVIYFCALRFFVSDEFYSTIVAAKFGRVFVNLSRTPVSCTSLECSDCVVEL